MTLTGETDLQKLLKTLTPKHHVGDYVFCAMPENMHIQQNDIIMFFHEEEGSTIIIKKELADHLQLPYSFIAAWITLTVHSSLAAVGLTAAFAKALTEKGISCNVVAALYPDHIFVDKRDVDAAMNVLTCLSE